MMFFLRRRIYSFFALALFPKKFLGPILLIIFFFLPFLPQVFGGHEGTSYFEIRSPLDQDLTLYPGETLTFSSYFHDYDNKDYNVASFWAVLDPNAGRFLEDPSVPRPSATFQAGSVPGSYNLVIKAACQSCPRPESDWRATTSVTILSPEVAPSPGASPVPSNFCEGKIIATDDPTYSCAQGGLGSEFEYFNEAAHAFTCKNDPYWYSLAIRASYACRGVSWVGAFVSCFRDKVGEERYTVLLGGGVQPSGEEMEVFMACFENPLYSVSYTPSETLPDEKTTCLIEAWGEERYQEISQGDVPTLEEEEAARVCFGAPPVEEAPPAVFELPAEVEACLLEALGQEKFEQLRSGRFEPTAEEIERGFACFEEINPIEGAVLPPPPEKVPLLPPAKELKVEGLKTEYQEVEGEKVPVQIVVSGKAFPNSTVSIYIFSEPLVLSAKTDANGVWTYYLRNPLDPGDHTAYVVARTEGGEEVRSELFNFRVAAAAPGEEGSFIVEEGLGSALTQYLLVGAAFVLIAAVFLLGMFWLKTKRPSAPPFPPAATPNP